MELVYLWVEDYKNIKRQGFNFSPRFRCKFYDEYEKDEKGKVKLKDNCKLEIIDKEETGEDYPKNFFGENINITAIVGENGSGKSSILKLLHGFFSKWIHNKVFIVFYYENKIYLYSTLNNKIDSKIETVTNLNDFKYFKSIHEVYFPNENDKKLYSNKSDKGFNLESSNLSHIIKHLLKAFIFLDKNNSLNVLFLPKYVEIYIEYHNLEKDLDNYESSHKDLILKKINELKNNKELNIEKILFQVLQILDLKSDTNKIVSFADFSTHHDELMKKYFGCEEYRYENSLKYDYRNLNLNQYKIENLDGFLKLELEKIDKEMLDFIQKLPSVGFRIELINDQNINFKSLSFGEMNLLNLLGSFLSLIEEPFYKEYGIELCDVGDCQEDIVEMHVEYNEVIRSNVFIIDEYELGLHPQWHKEILNKFIAFFKSFNKNIHLIITTHSPFILSDLPKKNVIFLKDGKQVDVDIETFGANIHTLLSHGFFMENGLMGEFAKEKIDKAIKYLNQKSLSEEEIEYCENIVSIIGEPILKRQLQKMLDSKRELSNAQEIDKIKEQIKELEKKLEEKKKAEDDEK